MKENALSARRGTWGKGLADRGHELRGFDRQTGISAGRRLCFREHTEPTLSKQSACKAENPTAASSPARPRVPRFCGTRILPVAISRLSRLNYPKCSIPGLEVLGTGGGVALGRGGGGFGRRRRLRIASCRRRGDGRGFGRRPRRPGAVVVLRPRRRDLPLIADAAKRQRSRPRP